MTTLTARKVHAALRASGVTKSSTYTGGPVRGLGKRTHGYSVETDCYAGTFTVQLHGRAGLSKVNSRRITTALIDAGFPFAKVGDDKWVVGMAVAR